MATQARAITLQIRLSDRRSPEIFKYVRALPEKSRAGLIRKILEDALERSMLSPEGGLRTRDAQISALTAEINRLRNAQLSALTGEAKRLGDAIHALLASETLLAKDAPSGERRPRTSLAVASSQGGQPVRSRAASGLVDFETPERLPRKA
jgi:hypothetical protein